MEFNIDTEVYRISDPENLNDDDIKAIDRAASVIREGGLAVFPTETVYGLGASAYSEDAASSVYAAKGRPSDNPLIVHVAKPADAADFAVLNGTYTDIAERFMPGAVTVILNKKDNIPSGVTGGLGTVAVRCPSNPIARELIKRAGVPIAAPSANLSGKPSPTRADHVVQDLSGRVQMILDGGNCTFGLESTVLKPESDGVIRILRPGAVTVEMLEAAGYTVIVDKGVTDLASVGESPESPGMKYRHYSPEAAVILIDTEGTEVPFAGAVLDIEKGENGNYAVLCDKSDSTMFTDATAVYTYSADRTEDSMAHELFSCLRLADDAGAERIYVPVPSTKGMGLAVYNRIIRAAGGRIIKIKDTQNNLK